MLIGRTVLGEVARNFLAWLVATTGVAFFILSITFLKRTPGVGMGFLVQVFPLFFPLALQFTVPLAALGSVVLTFSRMAGDGELTALAACGIPPSVVARPVLAAAAVVSLAALLLMDTLAPFAASRLRVARRDIIHQLHTSMRAGLSDLSLGPGRISFESFDGSSFKDVCLEWRQGDRVHLYRARTGAIAITDDDEVVLTLRNARGVMPYETKHGEWQGALKTITVVAQLDEITGGGNLARKRFDLESWELAYLSQRTLPKGIRITRSRAREEIARRSALAGSVFFFALIAIPLGILSRRGGRARWLLLASASILILYFPLVIGASSLARADEVPAYPALWAGNVLLMLLGLALSRRVLRI